MPHPEIYTIQTVPSSRLSDTQNDDIGRLMVESLSTDYPDVAPADLMRFVLPAQRTRRDMNQAVGGPTLRKEQSYANSVSVLALDADDELLAHFTMADNASAAIEQDGNPVLQAAMAAAKRWAKLHIAYGEVSGRPLIQSRYAFVGYAALGRRLRAGLKDTSPDEASPVDAMLIAGLRGRRVEQPASAYPYGNEKPWKRALLEAGYLPISNVQRIQPFGPEHETTESTWRSSVRAIRETIAGKIGGEALEGTIRS